MREIDPLLYREHICTKWDEIAEDYNVITTPFLELYLPKLIDLADLGPNMNVLDIGTGTGIAAFAASEAIKPDGRVLATDFSEHMLNLTRKNIEARSISNIDVFGMPAEELDIESEIFDRVICNFGLGFFADPGKALDEMYRVLKNNGMLTLSTWAKCDKCLVLGIIYSIMKDCTTDSAEEDLESVFAFGTPELLKNSLESAGFQNVKISEETHSARYKKAEDYWEKLIRTGPELQDIFKELSNKQKKTVKKRVIAEVEKYRDGEKIILPSKALYATGTKIIKDQENGL